MISIDNQANRVVILVALLMSAAAFLYAGRNELEPGRNDFDSEEERQLHEEQKAFREALKNAAGDASSWEDHDRLLAVYEENKEYLKELNGRGFELKKQKSAGKNDLQPERGRNDFESDEEWELYGERKEICEALRSAAGDASSWEDQDRVLALYEANKDYLKDLNTRANEFNEQEAVGQEVVPPELSRNAFESDEEWELHKERKDLRDAMGAAAGTASSWEDQDRVLALYEANIGYLKDLNARILELEKERGAEKEASFIEGAN